MGLFKDVTQANIIDNPQADGDGIVNLKKGSMVNLSKMSKTILDRIHVGLGWDVAQSGQEDFDLDASVFLLPVSGKIAKSADFVFFNNLVSEDGSVQHMGDNLTGAGEGDDESIEIQLSKISPYVQKVVFAVTIYDAKKRQQNFGEVSDAFIRIVDSSTNKEIARFDLTEEFSTSTSLIAGELVRSVDGWHFSAVGQGLHEEIDGVCRKYGVKC